jgi:hypothetical protein
VSTLFSTAHTTNSVIGTVGNTKGGNAPMSAHLQFEARQSMNISLASTRNNGGTAFTGYYWGYLSPEWNTYFVDLGRGFGYDNDFSSIPANPDKEAGRNENEKHEFQKSTYRLFLAYFYEWMPYYPL